MSDGNSIDQSELNNIVNAATDYLMKQKGWAREEFRVDYRGLSKDKSRAIVWGVYLDDERKPYGSPQKSVRLEIDRSSRSIVRELHAQ